MKYMIDSQSRPSAVEQRAPTRIPLWCLYLLAVFFPVMSCTVKAREWPEPDDAAGGGPPGDCVDCVGGAGGAGGSDGAGGAGGSGGAPAELGGCVNLPAAGDGVFAYCHEEPLTYLEAEQDCERRGGHLVSIHSQEEQDMIVAGAFASAKGQWMSWWIGLNDRDLEGTFTWTSGAPVDYTNWYEGEPNNSGGTEHCAHLYGTRDGVWNDLSCDAVMPYVCALP